MAQSEDVPFDIAYFSDDENGYRQAIDALELGDALYNGKGRFFDEALNQYLMAYSLNPNNALLNMKIGRCYLEILELEDALYYLDQAYRLNPEADGYMYFLHGQIYHLMGKWDQAIDKYEIFKRKALLNTESVVAVAGYFGLPEDVNAVREFVSARIAQCLNGESIMAGGKRASVATMGGEINSMYDDFNPVIAHDGKQLFFASRRPHPKGAKYNEKGLFYADAFSSQLDQRMWSDATIIEEFYSKSDDEIWAISNDGSTLLVNQDGTLFWSHRQGGNFGKSQKLKGLDLGKATMSSAWWLAADSTLYFTANLSDGTGTHDLFWTKMNAKGAFEPAHRLNEAVNSRGNEKGVFVSPDQLALFFVSDGHNSMGGYDVFRSLRAHVDSVWGAAENLGAPINTPYDQGRMVFGEDAKKGYFSSVMTDGMGGMEVCVASFDQDAFEPVPEVEVTLEGIVTNYNGEFVEAVITVCELNQPDACKQTKSQPNSGNYQLPLLSGKQYQLTAAAAGHVPYAEHLLISWVSTPGVKYQDVELASIDGEVEGALVSDVLFEPGSDRFLLGSEQVLNNVLKTMELHPSLSMTLAGFSTDNGSDVFNQELAKRQSAAVMKYLVAQGIESNRLKSTGDGSAPVIHSAMARSERRMQNRIAFKVEEFDSADLKTADMNRLLTQTQSSTSSQVAASANASGSGIPSKFVPADLNNDGYLSHTETYAAIDAFFEGEINLTVDGLYELIDFFFEQDF